MKTMTCRQLGGACDEEFTAATFDEMAELSKRHGVKMYQQQDQAHIKAMQAMQTLMQDPDAMAAWFRDKQQQFDQLP